MITVHYNGRLGNQLFQYCFGRRLAERLGYALRAAPIDGFPNTGRPVVGADLSSRESPLILTGHVVDLERLERGREIVLDGFFERYEYYRPCKKDIREEWLGFEPIACEAPHPRDVVVHVRLGHRHEGCALPFSYYREALSHARPRHVYVATDEPRHPFIDRFDLFSARLIRTSGPLDDFRSIARFNNIVMSQSTFAWWAAFLSRAERIFYPLPVTGRWNRTDRPDIDLRVTDEERYLPIICREAYGETLFERLGDVRRRLRSAAGGWARKARSVAVGDASKRDP